MHRFSFLGVALGLLFVLAPCADAAASRDVAPRAVSSGSAAGDPALRELYARRGGEPLWTGSERAASRRAAVIALLNREFRLGPTGAGDPSALERAFATADGAALARADLALTRAWLAYLGRRRGTSEAADPRVLERLWPLLDTPLGAEPLSLAALELAIVDALGGWRPVNGRLEEELELVAAEHGEGGATQRARRRWVVDRAQLVRRLVQSADLPARYLGATVPEPILQEAVRRFQRRHGLQADGTVGSRTLAAMNEPVTEQLARVRINLARAAALEPRNGLRRYVEVNIPAFELRYVENGDIKLRSRVIVGDDRTPTPIFDDVIRFVELDPSWYVPPSIVKEVLERNDRNPGYMERAGFVWQTTESGRTRLVQRPGPDNVLGRFKFVFPNHHAVYLHDTAQRSLFGRADQALSHGCVRVERPAELALALLGEQGWTKERLDQALAVQRTRRIELKDPVPVFLDYRTVDLDPDGRLVLLADLYGHDRAERTSFDGKRVLDDVGAVEASIEQRNAGRAGQTMVD
ncbi:MAG: L,D-transpeptidase family protein [Geminicoccaceae bacterium]|nr:L,D-transpeptidase family protein [Geminicoccaceae bacterium]